MMIGALDSTSATTAPSERTATAAPVPSPASNSSPAANASTAQPSTQVELSSTATQLGSSTEGSFDADKVKRISQAIHSGQYKVNPQAIADKLISNAAELLGRASS
jgi:negative regulator of flagellin synthesis FlgM